MNPNIKNRMSVALLLTMIVGAMISLAAPILKSESPIRFGLDLAGGIVIAYRPDLITRLDNYRGMDDEELLAICKQTLISRLSRKLSVMPEVYVRSDRKIIVSFPSIQNYSEILDLVGKTFHLSMRLVVGEYDEPQEGKELYSRRGQYYELASPQFTGDMLNVQKIRAVAGNPLASDHDLRFARVEFAFFSKHREAFELFTRQHIERDVAILLDDQIEFVGRIKGTIFDTGVLIGDYTLEEANDHAIMLRSGNLPLSLHVESMSAVGPSLGQEIKESGFAALLLSILLLLLLVAIAYSHRGWLLVAGTFSLFSLLLMIASLVAVTGLTIDTVGIAGLLLSVGMGIDAFIITFESLETRFKRFRPQELASYADRIVKSLYSFRHEGNVLFHAHVTTLLAIIMLLFTDHLRSFAMFIGLGILASVMTIFLTREFLQHTYRMAPNVGPSLIGWIRGRHPKLFRYRTIYFTGLLIVLGFSAWRLGTSSKERPFLRLGLDFRPGAQAVVAAPDEETLKKILADLQESIGDVNVRYQTLQSRAAQRYLLTFGLAISPVEKPAQKQAIPAFDESSHVNTFRPSTTPATAASEANIGPPNPPEETGMPLASFRKLLEKGPIDKVLSVEAIDSKISFHRLLFSSVVLILSFFFLMVYFVFLQQPINVVFNGDDLSVPGAQLRISAGAQLRISTGVLLALLVDITILIAGCNLLGIEFSLAVVAAILAIIGYSVNDSVVLSSHIQNEARSLASRGRLTSGKELVSGSIDSILSRVVITSFSTMLPALAILVVDLTPLRDFAVVILIGTVSGSLSSMFIVSSFAQGAFISESSQLQPTEAETPNEESVHLSTEELEGRLL